MQLKRVTGNGYKCVIKIQNERSTIELKEILRVKNNIRLLWSESAWVMFDIKQTIGLLGWLSELVEWGAFR